MLKSAPSSYFHSIELLHLAVKSRPEGTIACERTTEEIDSKIGPKSHFSTAEQEKHFVVFRELLDPVESDSLISKSTGKPSLKALLTEIDFFVGLLPGLLTPQKMMGLDSENEARSHFAKEYHEAILRIVLDNLKSILKYNSEDLNRSVSKLFVVEGGDLVILSNVVKALNDAVKKQNPPSQTTDFLLELIEGFVKCDLLPSAIARESLSCAEEYKVEDFAEVIRVLVSFPEKIANSTKGKNCEFFVKKFPDSLFYHVGCTLRILGEINRTIPVSSDLLSILLSKILTRFPRGYGLPVLVQSIALWANESPDVKKCLLEALERLNKSAIEVFVLAVLQNSQAPKHVESVLGKLASDSSDFKHVLCTKLTLLNYFNRETHPKFLTNLIGYLHLVSDKLVLEVLVTVLTVWGDKTAINHAPVDQHVYLSIMVVLCGKLLADTTDKDDREKLRRLLFDGVPVHLESCDEEIRALGMATAELVLPVFMSLQSKAELKFDFETFKPETKELVAYLKSLKIEEVPLTGNGDEKLATLFEPFECDLVKKSKPEEDVEILEQKQNIDSDESEIDSDDDLVPFDTSNDVKVSRIPPPKYLRDLIEGLADRQNVEKFVACFEQAEKIIDEQLASDDAKIGVDLIELFMSVDDSYGIERFLSIKFDCCVSIVCMHPRTCAEYICNEFNAQANKYSVADRAFMLDVLAGAARKLSDLTQASDDKTKRKKQRPLKEWEKVIEQRILSSTRIISKKSSVIVSKKNHFHEVAGSFFFPLVRDFGVAELSFTKTRKMDVVNDEFFLLTKYLNTISVVTFCAKNAPICIKIVKEVVALVWTVRFHPESKVRLAALSCVASVLLSAPRVSLTGDLLEHVLEYKTWLCQVSEKDPEESCRTFATHLCLLAMDLEKG